MTTEESRNSSDSEMVITRPDVPAWTICDVVSKPRHWISISTLLDAPTFKVKEPSCPVTTPFVVPLTRTVAPQTAFD